MGKSAYVKKPEWKYSSTIKVSILQKKNKKMLAFFRIEDERPEESKDNRISFSNACFLFLLFTNSFYESSNQKLLLL